MRKTFFTWIVLLGLACGPLWADPRPKYELLRPNVSLKTIKETKKQSLNANRWINVTLKVTGCEGAVEAKPYHVLYGSTAADVLGMGNDVKNGVVCCRPDDIKSVNGKDTDFAGRKFWMVAINGNHNVSPNNTLLEDGDQVEWSYHDGGK